MSLLLGTIVPQPIKISSSYLVDILKEVKHYLTLQTGITLTDNQHFFMISSARKLFSTESNGKNLFNIPKNFDYLFTHLQKIFVQNQEDLEFFDVCYECLMIVKEYLPNKIEIQVEIMEQNVGEKFIGNQDLSLIDFVENFENQKNEEFSRRINSNFKALISYHEFSLTKFEVQNILYLAEHFYFYKNKLAALKYLAYNQKIPKQVFAQIGDQHLSFLKELTLDEDFKAFCEQIMEKVAVAREIIMNRSDQESLSEMDHLSKSNSRKIKKQQQSDFINGESSQSPLKNQKQFRLPNNRKNSSKMKQKDRSPLKLSSKQNKNINIAYEKQQKEDKLLNLSVKNLLFQLRESQSLKRLSMLIEAAAEMKIEDQKYDIKIEKEIENVCRKFLKQIYLERYATNQNILEQSSKKGIFQKQKQNFFEESFIPTPEQVQEVSKFYKSLIFYFSRKDSSLKISKNQGINIKGKGLNDAKSFGQKNGQYRQLLEQICQKIEQKYYGQ